MIPLTVAFLLGLVTAYGLCRPQSIRSLESDAQLAFRRLLSGRERIRLAIFITILFLFVVSILSISTGQSNDFFRIQNPCSGRNDSWCWTLDEQNQWTKAPT